MAQQDFAPPSLRKLDGAAPQPPSRGRSVTRSGARGRVEHRFDGVADRAGLLVFFTFLVYLVASAIHSPHWSWDLVPYVACALENRFPDSTALHSATFEEVRRIVPPARFVALTSGVYFGDVFHDPESLRQQLPFYRTRPVYVELIRLISRAGVSPVIATLAISITASASFALLLLVWLRAHLALRAAGPLAVLVSVLAGLPTIARVSSPDAISGLCLLGVLYAVCERSALGLAAAGILLSVGVRSDNVLFGLAFTALLFSLDRRGGRLDPWRYAATALAIAFVYSVVIRAASAYPWTTLFVHSFGGQLPQPAGWHGRLSPYFYLATIARNARHLAEPQPAAIALLGVLTFVQTPPADGLGLRTQRAFPPFVLLLVLVRYLLFPSLMVRHLFPFYSVIALLFLLSNGELARRFGRPPTQKTSLSPLAVEEG